MLNALNLRKAGARITNGGRVLEIDVLGSDGRRHMIGYALPPGLAESDEFTADTAHLPDPKARDFRDDDPSTLTGSRALFAFSQFAKALSKVAGDRALTSEGKALAVAAAGGQVLQTFGPHYTGLQVIAPKIEARGAALLAAPQADAIETGWDIEIYRAYQSRSPLERQQFSLSLAEPQNARELLALKRTPAMLLDPTARERVDSGWVSHVTRQRPAEMAAFQTAKTNHEWAAGLLPFLAKNVRDPGTPEGSSAVARLDAYKILKHLSATRLLGFGEDEVQMLEHRITTEAARAAETARRLAAA